MLPIHQPGLPSPPNLERDHHVAARMDVKLPQLRLMLPGLPHLDVGSQVPAMETQLCPTDYIDVVAPKLERFPDIKQKMLVLEHFRTSSLADQIIHRNTERYQEALTSRTIDIGKASARLSIRSVAELLCLSRTQINYWIQENWLPAVHNPNSPDIMTPKIPASFVMPRSLAAFAHWRLPLADGRLNHTPSIQYAETHRVPRGQPVSPDLAYQPFLKPGDVSDILKLDTTYSQQQVFPMLHYLSIGGYDRTMRLFPSDNIRMIQPLVDAIEKRRPVQAIHHDIYSVVRKYMASAEATAANADAELAFEDRFSAEIINDEIAGTYNLLPKARIERLFNCSRTPIDRLQKLGELTLSRPQPRHCPPLKPEQWYADANQVRGLYRWHQPELAMYRR